ncbi:hypothetical protein [Sphingobium fuliginis]|uniref:hypothetical protein n=1 Tax=Sphingobium fuliginis (strain ATCC 27551) TaxID=336203 RepID=UPI000402CBEC|nr:hypothetical protein [Sphingobium fuliginis]
MADTWIQGSFAFNCTNTEMALIEEAFQVAPDLMDDCEPSDPTPEFLAIFPPTDPADCLSGLRAIFSDPNFPSSVSTSRVVTASKRLMSARYASSATPTSSRTL